MAFLIYLTTVFGILMSVANLPQAYKIFKRKSAKDISLLTYLLFFVGSIIWVFYGISLSNPTIIYSYAIGTLSCFLVLLGWFFYR
jgi:MtN3 and saliva related transmembrane protein